MPISAAQLDLTSHLEAGGTNSRQLRIAAGALGNGLTGGGASAISASLDSSGALEFNAAAIRVKLDGVSLARGASGIKVDTTQSFTFSGGLKRSGSVSASDDVTDKAYVDSVASGLDVKKSVRVATIGALPAHTRTGMVLTASANGALGAQDGVSLAVGNRLLVKDEGAGSHLENGIYDVTDLGSAGTPWILTRSSDFDTDTEVTGGAFTFVTEGTSFADSGWVLSTNDAIVVNTTALVFTQFSSNGVILAGAGMTKTGNTIDVIAADTSLTIGTDSMQVNVGGTSGLQVSSGVKIKLEASNPTLQIDGSNQLGVKVSNGLEALSSGLAAKVDVASTGATASVLKNGASGLAIGVDNSTVEGSAAGGSLRVKDSGITAVKLGFKDVVDTFAAAAGTYDAGEDTTNFTLTQTFNSHANVLDVARLLRNGIDDQSREASLAAVNAAGEWFATGTLVSVHGNVTASGDTYRFRYIA